MALGLDRISIRAKLLLAFAVMMLGAAAMAGLALQQVRALGAAAGKISSSVASLSHLDAMATDIGRAHLSDLDRHFGTGDIDRDRALKAGDTAREQMTQSWKSYVGTGIDPGEEAEDAAAITDSWKRFTATEQQVLALDKAGAHDQAQALLQGDSRLAVTAFRDAVLKDSAFQVTENGKNAESAAGAVRWAFIVLLGALAAMSALALGAGLAMVRGISNPIVAFTAAMRGLAEKRDMSAATPGSGRSAR